MESSKLGPILRVRAVLSGTRTTAGGYWLPSQRCVISRRSRTAEPTLSSERRFLSVRYPKPSTRGAGVRR